MVAAKRFSVVLERVQKTGTMFRVPFDLEEAFERARPPVRITIRDEEAKRPETRARRIAGTLARVRTGETAR